MKPLELTVITSCLGLMLIGAFMMFIGILVTRSFDTNDVNNVTMLIEECVNHQVLVKHGHDKFLRLNPKTMQPLTCESKGRI